MPLKAGWMREISPVQFAKSALVDELQTAAIYGKLAERYRNVPLATKLRELANTEAKHAEFWAAFLSKRKADVRGHRVSRFRVALFLLAFRLLGVGLGLRLLEKGEHSAVASYGAMLASAEISDEEKRRIREILADELEHEDDFEEYGERHKFFVDKVAVILTQMSGGLVTVLFVSAGLVGVHGQPFMAAVAGMLVGLTEAVNSAVGFYFFGNTERQVKLGVVSRLGKAVDALPELFTQKLVRHLKEEDLSEQTAVAIGEEVVEKKDLLKKMVAEHRYGIVEKQLESPTRTAFYAGLFRVLGTFLPLVPYFLNLSATMALPLSVLITLSVVALMGFVVAVSAEISVKKKIAELTISGLALTAIAFLIGVAASRLASLLQ